MVKSYESVYNKYNDDCKTKEILEIVDKNAIIVMFDLKGRITHANKKCCSHTGYNKEFLLGRSYKLFFNEIAIEDDLKVIQETLSNKEEWEGILKNKYNDGSTYWMLINLYPMMTKNNRIKHYVCYCVDFTSNINQQNHIALQNTYDNLTGLYKGNLLDKTLLANEENRTNSSLILIDILNFSDVNTFYGMSKGNEVLKQVAMNLQTNFTEAKIFRIQGNSFALLVKEKQVILPSNNQLNKLIKKILTMFDFAFIVDNDEINLTVTLGVTGGHINLFKKAISALVEAKSLNLNYIINDEELTNKLTNINNEKKNLTNVLNKAIRENTIVPYYQPILCNDTNKIVKYECLARIVTEDMKEYMPNDFIELSKRIRKYEHITRTIIEKSFKYFEHKNVKFSINLSIEDIINKNTREFIYKKLNNYKKPYNVIFEILEDENLFNHEKAFKDFVVEVKKIGCEIAIDDFGTGFSNFGNLMSMEIDYIKIDGSIISKIDDENVYKILKNIVLLAQDLKVKTIAEFVSSEKLLEQVSELGIHFSQGWEIGKPNKELICK